jgi:hypothetical protein
LRTMRQPQAALVAAIARSPTVSTALETAARARADAEPTIGRRPAYITSSRTPSPDGRIKTKTPAIIAVAMVPVHCARSTTPVPGLLSTSNHRCVPNKA